MGFFDLLNPAFSTLDNAMASLLPGAARLILWSLVGAFATMAIYKLVSRQQRMKEIKDEIAAVQGQLWEAEEFDQMLPAIRRNLSLALKLLGLALGPALIASIPIIFLLVWASNQYGHAMPQPGDTVMVSTTPQGGVDALNWPGKAASSAETGLTWPADGQPIKITDDQSQPILVLPIPAASPVVHKRYWLNALIGNPAGYLAESAPVDAIHLDLPSQRLLPGPWWLGHWMTLLMGGLFLFSLIIKIVLKIE